MKNVIRTGSVKGVPEGSEDAFASFAEEANQTTAKENADVVAHTLPFKFFAQRGSGGTDTTVDSLAAVREDK